MNIIAIESSCDDTAAAVVCDGRKVLSSVTASQISEHQLYGGVVPEIASRRHMEAIVGVVDAALSKSGLGIAQLDAIAVTSAPGLIGSLLVGVSFAKGFSLAHQLPLIPVHHIRGHIAANYLVYPELEPPFLCLVASGGHSHLIEVSGYTRFRVIGRTRDDAVGECYDKVARAMGFPYPGGASLDKLAQEGTATAFRLPKPRVEGSPYDLSFSGLKTAMLNLMHNIEQKGEKIPLDDLSASFQSTAISLLTSRLEKAAKDFGYRKIAVAGGVCANSELRKRVAELCVRENWDVFIPALELCGDNAAMIGAQAFYEHQAENLASMDLNPQASLSVELL